MVYLEKKLNKLNFYLLNQVLNFIIFDNIYVKKNYKSFYIKRIIIYKIIKTNLNIFIHFIILIFWLKEVGASTVSTSTQGYILYGLVA